MVRDQTPAITYGGRESRRKVFKIVFAEGHFNELYTFEESKKLFGFLPSKIRALVIIEAKVLVGLGRG